MAPIKIFLIIKDWQGNVRVTIDQNGNVIEAVDYYPYNVDHQSNEYIIGRNETNSIDISDINAIGSGDKPMTSIGALTHEMYENHLTQTMGLDLNAAHKKASTLEGKVTGYYISPYSRNFSASGVSVFNVDFPKNSGKVILYHSNNNLLYILHNR